MNEEQIKEILKPLIDRGEIEAYRALWEAEQKARCYFVGWDDGSLVIHQHKDIDEGTSHFKHEYFRATDKHDPDTNHFRAAMHEIEKQDLNYHRIIYELKGGKTLPDKMSDLIFLALHDLELVEKSPKHHVNMDYWHTPFDEAEDLEPEEAVGLDAEVCLVCFAGAVMSQTLGFDHEADVEPCHMRNVKEDPEQKGKLLALDYLRSGSVWSAFIRLNLDAPEKYHELRDITPYKANPKEFKKQMLDLAYELKEDGF